jgi:hypothetical protein
MSLPQSCSKSSKAEPQLEWMPFNSNEFRHGLNRRRRRKAECSDFGKSSLCGTVGPKAQKFIFCLKEIRTIYGTLGLDRTIVHLDKCLE